MTTYIIAEAGVNHNGSPDRACRMVEAAAKAGANAVKFQTFKAERLVCRSAPKAAYQARATDASESQYEMLRKLELDQSAHAELIACCSEHGISFLSTPFDLDSVDMLVNTFKLPFLKVPSGEITNAPLLLKIACTGVPVILSTGMCTLGDVEAALSVLAFGYLNQGIPATQAFRSAYCSTVGQAVLRDRVTLMHCTTEYPAPLEDVNLRAMDTLRTAFGLQVGYSDHTEGIAVPIAAVARGAVMLEKHFTLDHTLPGPDHRASLEPDQLARMVAAVRDVERAIGSGVKAPTPRETSNMGVARKSVVASDTIRSGEQFTTENLAVKRPGNGISPMSYWELLGKKAGRDFSPDEAIEL